MRLLPRQLTPYTSINIEKNLLKLAHKMRAPTLLEDTPALIPADLEVGRIRDAWDDLYPDGNRPNAPDAGSSYESNGVLHIDRP